MWTCKVLKDTVCGVDVMLVVFIMTFHSLRINTKRRISFLCLQISSEVG